MANKILETLTIGGTSFDMHSAQIFSDSKDITLSNRGTWYTGGTLTITEPGVYIMLGSFGFPSATTTGQTYHQIRIKTGDDARTVGEFSPANNALSMQICQVIKIETVPVTVSVDAMCYSAINTAGTAGITAWKILDLGGGNP